MSGRTFWFMKDASWYTRDEVRRAARKFGSVGPGVMDWLYCAAKRENIGGRLKAGAFTIADELGDDEVTVRNVVSHLVTRCWLVEYVEDGDTFKALVVWYKADQERGLGAERQAQYRASSGENRPLVTDRNAMSQFETKREEKKREEVGAKAPTSGRVELPADFPPELRPHLTAAFKVLRSLAERQGAKAVQPISLASVVSARRHKPLVRAAHDYAAWADGKAQRRKDVIAGYRNWLDRTDDLAAIELLDSDGSPAAVVGTPNGFTNGRKATTSELLQKIAASQAAQKGAA